MKCQFCGVLVTQDEADEAAYILPGIDITLCPPCARAERDAQAEDGADEDESADREHGNE